MDLGRVEVQDGAVRPQLRVADREATEAVRRELRTAEVLQGVGALRRRPRTRDLHGAGVVHVGLSEALAQGYCPFSMPSVSKTLAPRNFIAPETDCKDVF